MHDETGRDTVTRRRGDAAKKKGVPAKTFSLSFSPRHRVATSPRLSSHRVTALPRYRLLSLLTLIVAFAFVVVPVSSWVVLAQDNESPWKSGAPTPLPPRSKVVPDEGDIVERAIGAACAERASDPLGSIPIDVMQARPSLPVNDPDALAGARRAERLLPVAKALVIESLKQLAREYGIYRSRIRVASLRVMAVNKIEPDMELRDNASVLLNTPRVIYFGTIFLAGLPSDEGMVSVLAHELTHIADGREDVLQTLFHLIGQRATSLTGFHIYGRRPEELTCDLVGAMAASAFITRTPNDEALGRRLARAVEHNCVKDDDTDEAHLSPRSTMRALLSLDPTLARDIIGDDETPFIIQPAPIETTTLAPAAPVRRRTKPLRSRRRPRRAAASSSPR